MANEITIDARLTAEKGTQKWERIIRGDKYDWTGTSATAQTQSIATSHEAITIGSDVGTAGWALLQNVDADNYIEIGLDVSSTFYPLAKLEPGEAMVCRLATKSIYAQADTAAADLFYLVLED